MIDIQFKAEYIQKQYLQKNIYKKLKKLCMKETGTPIVILDNHITIVGYYNNHVVCMCSISNFSPGNHFDNETNGHVAYLYNYICDSKYRKHKVSVSLMTFVKDFIINSTNYSHEYINLDIECGNNRAIKFFERNNFIYYKDYSVGNKNYLAYVLNTTI